MKKEIKELIGMLKNHYSTKNVAIFERFGDIIVYNRHIEDKLTINGIDVWFFIVAEIPKITKDFLEKDRHDHRQYILNRD